MDLATLIGIIIAFAMVFVSMVLGGSLIIFINVPSILLVVGGTIAVVMMKFNLSQYLNAIKIAKQAFFSKSMALTELIDISVKLATAARKGGLLSLENFTVEHPVLKQGIQLLVDGHDGDVVRGILQKDMALTIERHMIGQKIFKAMADVAPAMGMIGTLVGLVQMLSAMDDPKSIGPAMAVALLTTLYGAVLANMLATPIADKLELRMDEERNSRSLIIDALSAMQAGQNPRMISEMLKNYLPPTQRNFEAENNTVVAEPTE